MDNGVEELSLQDHVSVLRRRWTLIAGVRLLLGFTRDSTAAERSAIVDFAS